MSDKAYTVIAIMIHLIQLTWNSIISTEDALGIPTTYAGLHKLWYPGIRDMSTWGKFGAHGEHGDVFLFSNLGAL